MEPEIHFTLGPACQAEAELGAVLAAPVRVCRLNLSHAEASTLPDSFDRVRRAAERVGRSVRIGADLRGRKMRVGPLPGGEILLEAGAPFELRPVGTDEETPGSAESASVNCPSLAGLARAGDEVLLDDGALRLRVESVGEEAVRCEVVVGGPLPERSGFNLPGRAIDLPALTAKDEADLDALAPLAPDLVYLSYVERAEDVAHLRRALEVRGLRIPIVAKIERAVAVENAAAIAEAADALCLARGDLGVEVDLPRLPAVQRRVVAAAREAQTPILLAGEVLWTLVSRPVPSRAELTDVATAVEQGFSGFVLSDETAVGRDPAGAVRWLHRLATGG